MRTVSTMCEMARLLGCDCILIYPSIYSWFGLLCIFVFEINLHAKCLGKYMINNQCPSSRIKHACDHIGSVLRYLVDPAVASSAPRLVVVSTCPSSSHSQR
jgi:hypothetical protein